MDGLLLYQYICFVIVYCCPSGFSELRPARKISSVDNRLTAMTELCESDQCVGSAAII